MTGRPRDVAYRWKYPQFSTAMHSQEIDPLIHGRCRCAFQHGARVYLCGLLVIPSAYGIMNWSFINKRRTPGSSHVLHSSHELLQIDFMCFLLCLLSTLLSLELLKHSANTWFDFYVSEAIYGHIVWAWKESLLTPTHREFYAPRMLDWMIQKKRLSVIHLSTAH